jgi:release factor-specific protein-(glutamine-N5) methyltransferase
VPEKVWTVGDAMDWTVGYFEERDTPEPRRSAEWLLSAATGLSRIELYAHRQRPLTPEERTSFRHGIERRSRGMPLQYVTGEVPFRRLVLHVRPGVFIPRPETEILVDVALEHLAERPVDAVVVDLCTGSGAVALAIATERAGTRIWATEASETALAVACDNRDNAGISDGVHVLLGDLFEPLPDDLKGRVELIVTNPPYVPTDDLADLPDEVASYEPALALDGGLDGLQAARRIAQEAPDWLAPGGMLALEVDARHAREAADLLSEGFTDVFVRKDLTGRDRIVGGSKEAVS